LDRAVFATDTKGLAAPVPRISHFATGTQIGHVGRLEAPSSGAGRSIAAASGGTLGCRETRLARDSGPAVGEIGGKANRPDSKRLGGPVAILPDTRMKEFDVGTQRVRANFPGTCLMAVGIAARPCNCPWGLLVNWAAIILPACAA
jgi:hypothetical protein